MKPDSNMIFKRLQKAMQLYEDSVTWPLRIECPFHFDQYATFIVDNDGSFECGTCEAAGFFDCHETDVTLYLGYGVGGYGHE